MIPRLFMIMAMIAEPSVPQPKAGCTAAQVVSTGIVSAVSTSSSSVGIDLRAKGLQVMSASNVTWSACSIGLQSRTYGGWAITEGGIQVMPREGRLVTRQEPVPEAAIELPHPEIAKASFVGSTPLQIGDLRAGIWTTGGTSIIAYYHPGQPARPVPILVSKFPVLGASYLGSPDSASGALQLWQKISSGRYRYVRLSWSEQGVR